MINWAQISSVLVFIMGVVGAFGDIAKSHLPWYGLFLIFMSGTVVGFIMAYASLKVCKWTDKGVDGEKWGWFAFMYTLAPFFFMVLGVAVSDWISVGIRGFFV